MSHETGRMSRETGRTCPAHQTVQSCRHVCVRVCGVCVWCVCGVCMCVCACVCVWCVCVVCVCVVCVVCVYVCVCVRVCVPRSSSFVCRSVCACPCCFVATLKRRRLTTLLRLPGPQGVFASDVAQTHSRTHLETLELTNFVKRLRSFAGR
jgi:hypothetical protein